MAENGGKSAVVIERCGVEALDELAPLFDRYRQHYGLASDAARGRVFLEARLRAGDSVVFLARTDGEAAGFTQLYPLLSSLSMFKVWLLNDLFVAAPARGWGVGRALMDHAIRFARDDGAGRVELATEVDNGVAQGLYESLGFKVNEGFLRYELEL